MNNIIYFELNNWQPETDYPPMEPFESWLDDDLEKTLTNDKWAKSNKICISFTIIDMSFNFAITAPLSWVKENCPGILEEPWKSKFCYDKKDEEVVGKFGYFLPYEEKNFGVTFTR